MWNIKEDSLENPLAFTVWTKQKDWDILQNIFYVLQKKVLQVWNDIRASKWWNYVVGWNNDIWPVQGKLEWRTRPSTAHRNQLPSQNRTKRIFIWASLCVLNEELWRLTLKCEIWPESWPRAEHTHQRRVHCCLQGSTHTENHQVSACSSHARIWGLDRWRDATITLLSCAQNSLLKEKTCTNPGLTFTGYTTWNSQLYQETSSIATFTCTCTQMIC